MSDRPSKERSRLIFQCKKLESSGRKLSRTRSSSFVVADITRDKNVEQCLRLVALAAYAHTIGVEATRIANDMLEASRLASLKANQMTEFAHLVSQYAKQRANVISDNNFNLAQIYALASSHPLSLYGFLQVVAPPSYEYFDKVSSDGTADNMSYGASTSSDALDRFSWPSVRRIKSITELHESHANMVSATERKRRGMMVTTQLLPSPLLSKEDADNIQKTLSPKVSQHSGIQLHKYSIRPSRSAGSSMSFSSQ